MSEPVFTVGHATRSVEELVALLAPNGVKRIVDVRTVPRSRTNPQFNKDAFPAALAPFGIAYEHVAPLGGLRGRVKGVSPDLNGLWENASFHNYADHALGPAFREGFEHLLRRAESERCAIMCAETVWWRCHRRIITDYLLAAGRDVFHIVSSDVPEPAKLTPGAQPLADGTIVYPGAQAGLGL